MKTDRFSLKERWFFFDRAHVPSFLKLNFFYIPACFRNICAHVNPILTEIRYVHVWTENMGSGPLGKVSFRMLDDPFQEIRTI